MTISEPMTEQEFAERQRLGNAQTQQACEEVMRGLLKLGTWGQTAVLTISRSKSVCFAKIAGVALQDNKGGIIKAAMREVKEGEDWLVKIADAIKEVSDGR